MTKTKLRLAVCASAIVAVLVAGPSLAAEPKYGSPSCAYVPQIRNFNEIDDYSATFETSPSQRFKVTFMNRCREMRYAAFSRVEAWWTCLRRGDKVIVGTPWLIERCIVRSVEPLLPLAREQPASN